jgi:hypothetical protein
MASKKPVDRLFPKNYWDRPEPNTTGDSDEKGLFTAIGQALSAWEYVEDRLADMCVTFASIRKDDHYADRVIRRLFGSINASSDRRKAIKATAELYFWPHDKDNSMGKKLEMLLQNIAAASRLRDDIAHGMASSFYSGERSIGVFLVPTGYKTDRNWGVPRPLEPAVDKSVFPWDILPGQYRYNSSDINNIRDKFEGLVDIVIKHDADFTVWKVGVLLASTPPDS